MVKTSFVLAALLLSASSTFAQTPACQAANPDADQACASPSLQREPALKIASYGVLFAGAAADLITTHQAIGRGAYEGNPALRDASTQKIDLAKAVGVGAVVGVSALLDHFNHHGAAHTVRFIGGGLWFSAAIHNNGVAR